MLIVAKMVKQKSLFIKILTVSASLLILSACSTTHSPKLVASCAQALDKATQEYATAESLGFRDTSKMSKASSLIAAAKIKQQEDKYPNCINKVQRASAYIRQAQVSTANLKP